MEQYDVIVIGGGPAGLMAAIAAAGAGAGVLLLEKGDRLARKLLISGGGRCNVTNRKPVPQLVAEVPRGGRFMYSSLAQFGPEEIIQFFESLGIALKEEANGRVFPQSDKAASIAQALLRRLQELGVTVRLESPVANLLLSADRCSGVRLRTGEEIAATAVVVAVGGKSVPQTGSTGDGYAWAEAAGHTVTPLFPTEVPLTVSDPWVADHSLQGLSLRDVTLQLFDPDGKRLTVQQGDVLFTHFGLSGPAALRVSHYVSLAIRQGGTVPLTLTMDLLPDRPLDQVHAELLGAARAEPKKSLRNILKPFLPDRLIPLLLGMAGVDPTLTFAHLPKGPWMAFCRLVKAMPVHITGTRSLAEAFVTGGGVHVGEVDPATMSSRRKQGLFFAGEVLDVNAHTGGYNITLAFASGHAAGLAAANMCNS